MILTLRLGITTSSARHCVTVPPYRNLLFMVILLTAGRAQDSPEFSTGRPGHVETIHILPRGYYQFESNWTPPNDGGVIMLRTGLTQKLEARFTLDDLFSESSSNLGGGTAGLLMAIREDGGLPGMGVALSLSVPDTDGFQMDAAQINLVFPFSKGLTDDLGLDWHLAASHADGELAFSFASLLGYGISERVGLFVGSWGGSPMDAMSDMSLSMDTGFTYMLRDNIQLDLNGGIPITDNGEAVFIDMGVSFRLPN